MKDVYSRLGWKLKCDIEMSSNMMLHAPTGTASIKQLTNTKVQKITNYTKC